MNKSSTLYLLVWRIRQALESLNTEQQFRAVESRCQLRNSRGNSMGGDRKQVWYVVGRLYTSIPHKRRAATNDM